MRSHICASHNLAEVLRERACAEPETLALRDGPESVSYGSLAARAGSVARLLAEEGVGEGDRVALLLRRGADGAAAFFGVLAAGATAVIVAEQLRPRQIAHILEHSGSTLLLSSAELTERLGGLSTSGVSRRDIAELPAGAPLQPLRRIESDIAQIIYTSGSTGLAKGVVVSHGNLRSGTEAVLSYLHIAAEDRLASLLPFSFDYGLNQLLCAVAAGAALIVERSPIPARIVHTLRQEEVTVLAAVPPLWLALLGVDGFRRDPLESLRVMTNTGGRLPVEAVRSLRNAHPRAELFLMYGLTEAFRSTYLAPASVDEKPDSIGRAIPGAEIMVLAEDLKPCPAGEPGELVHRGPTVALGYWKDPAATAHVYRPNPLLPDGAPEGERVVFSGDIVERDEQGDIFFIARNDGLIKTLGFRVSPDEVVDVLYASGEVREAVVGSQPDELRGVRVVAYVVLEADGSASRLEQFCAREMPSYMRPRIELRDSIELTASGKYDVVGTAKGR